MDYSKLTIAELREAAKTKGIRNVSAMKKKELAELLENVEKMIRKSVGRSCKDRTSTPQSHADLLDTESECRECCSCRRKL